MKNKKILIIDDGDVEQIVERITSKLRRKGIYLEADVLNVSEVKFKKSSTEGQVIDFDKIKQELQNEYFPKRYDLVLCDFSYGDDPLNGYEVIKWLINESKNKKVKIRHSAFISYSSEEEKFKQEIFDNQSLKRLFKLDIQDFFDRTRLAEDVPSLIIKQDKILDYKLHFISLLEQNPDFVFENGYPPFSGKKLKNIANEIEKDNDQGREFQKELFDLTYAHIINLNEEYQ
jgi:CheY-like chemotaxis protein